VKWNFGNTNHTITGSENIMPESETHFSNDPYDQESLVFPNKH